MFVMLDVSQALTFWLKAEAPSNMAATVVTLDVFQPVTLWLKSVASKNM